MRKDKNNVGVQNIEHPQNIEPRQFKQTEIGWITGATVRKKLRSRPKTYRFLKQIIAQANMINAR